MIPILILILLASVLALLSFHGPLGFRYRAARFLRRLANRVSPDNFA